MNVGFIGLGTMGSGIAHNLIGAGYSVVVHDLHRERGREYEERGATWAESLQDFADVDVVFTSPGLLT